MKLGSKQSLRDKKILITCGPTWVPIDDMRVLSNRSTGEMGHTIARRFYATGAKVTMLEGPIAARTRTAKFRIRKFCFYDELSRLLTSELKQRYDIVIHAAAVADFQLARPYRSKIDSNAPKLKLTLIPTKKIVNRIKKLDASVFLVGFKLESTLGPKTVLRRTKHLFTQARCDAVVANSVRAGRYKGFLLDRNSGIVGRGQTRDEIARKLVAIVTKHYKTAAQ